MKLTAENVTEVYKDCLFTDEEYPNETPSVETLPEGAVVTDGILNKTAFHPGRLEGHRQDIIDMLHGLPTEFQSTTNGGGGGWSFLNACMDNEGGQWTGMHQTQDMLVQLGIGIGAADYLLPRDIWSALPGGMPYFAVTQ